MPTYTYVCKKCGAEVEAFQSMTDPPLKRCRQCRGALQRTFHPVGIVLKGSGFHRNDYPRSGSRSRDSKDEGSSGSKSSGSKSEGSKSEGSKSEGSKSEGSKSEGSSGSKGERSSGSDSSASGAKRSSSSSDD